MKPRIRLITFLALVAFTGPVIALGYRVYAQAVAVQNLRAREIAVFDADLTEEELLPHFLTATRHKAGLHKLEWRLKPDPPPKQSFLSLGLTRFRCLVVTPRYSWLKSAAPEEDFPLGDDDEEEFDIEPSQSGEAMEPGGYVDHLLTHADLGEARQITGLSVISITTDYELREVMPEIVACRGVTLLHLDAPEASLDDLKAAIRMPSLRWLVLKRCDVSDSSVFEAIENAKRLDKVYLINCRVPAESSSLLKLRNQKRVREEGCSAASIDGPK